jgi:hypothetical protein
MLKVIVMIDCNICGQLFDHVTTSCDRDPLAWKALSQDLEYKATNHGWSMVRSSHHCPFCVPDVLLCGANSASPAVDDDDEIPF